MNILVIVNEQPYCSERPYNALRLAGALSKREDTDVRVFLTGRRRRVRCRRAAAT